MAEAFGADSIERSQDDTQLRGTFTMDAPLPPGFPFGEDSVLRRMAAEPIGNLMTQRAVLLQVAHPMVGAAVREHSTVQEHPFKRLRSTSSAALRLIHGTEEEARQVAQGIYNIHNHINGTLPEGGGPWSAGERYDAHHGPSLLWVWATKLDGLIAEQRYTGLLTDAERPALYNEMVTFARFFGIPEELIPQTPQAFSEYFVDMLYGDKLGSTPTSRDMMQRVLYPDKVPERIARVFRGVTWTTLDPELREHLGFSLPPEEQERAERVDDFLRKHYQKLPDARLKGPALMLKLARSGARIWPPENRPPLQPQPPAKYDQAA